MIRVDGIKEVNTYLGRLSRELPRAAVKATDRLVFKVLDGQKAQMVADIDRPRPYSLGALNYKRPTLASPVGEVFIRDQFRRGQIAKEGNHYLGIQISGGRRTRNKRSEIALKRMGLMPRGSVWVPASGTRLDAGGNVPGLAIRSMIDEFRTYKKQRREGRRFYLRGGAKIPPIAIYRKLGRRWVPFLRFVSARTYRKRYRFFERADQEVAYHFASIYGREIERELKRR